MDQQGHSIQALRGFDSSGWTIIEVLPKVDRFDDKDKWHDVFDLHAQIYRQT